MSSLSFAFLLKRECQRVACMDDEGRMEVAGG